VNIREFLNLNPLSIESDVDFCLLEGKYDEDMIQTYHDNLNHTVMPSPYKDDRAHTPRIAI